MYAVFNCVYIDANYKLLIRFLLNMDQRTRLTHLEVKHINQKFIIEKK